MKKDKIEDWVKYYKLNNCDGYSRAVRDTTKKVMMYLDETPAKLVKGYSPNMKTAHGIICSLDIDYGLSGFQGQCIARNVEYFHERGDEFASSYFI